MLLETYISDLLYRYDCVTIPDFGAFLTQKTSAELHQSTHSFYPPKKVLSFNEQLKHNDGLLANYIAEADKIPYASAVEKISRHVKLMKSYLTQGEVVSFKSIGQLTLNTNGNLVFDPSLHINYLTDAFGLAHFTTNQISREVYKEEVVAIEAAAPLAITPEKRKNNNWLKYAVAAVFVLGIGGFSAATYYNKDVNTHNQIAQEEAQEQLDAKIQEATFVISNPLPAATLTVKKQTTGTYHIIGGAFRVEANAQKKIKQLQAKGYKARAIGKNAYGLHQVVYASFNDRNTAINALRKIQRQENRAAWMLVKDLD